MNRRNDTSDDFTDDEEDYRPSRRLSQRNDAADDSDDDDDRPVRRTPAEDATPQASRRVIRRGWAAAEQLKESGSAYAQTLKLSDLPQLIKFLEDEPYAAYRTHWVEGTSYKQKSWLCLDDLDPKGCPLCEAGNRPSQKFSFNTVLLGEGLDPVIKSFDVGVRVLDQLKNFHMDQRQGPLSKHYWAVSRTGKGTSSSTNLQMVRERDLEDFAVDALSPDDLKDLRRKAYDESIIAVPTRKDLLSVAEELG